MWTTLEEPVSFLPAISCIQSLREDLYVTLMAFDRSGANATLRVIVNPGVPWLWIGGLIVGLGAILAIAPQGGARRKPETRHAAPEA